MPFHSEIKNRRPYLSLNNNVSLSGQRFGVEVVIVKVKVRLVLRIVGMRSDEFAVKFLGQDNVSEILQSFRNSSNVQVRQYQLHKLKKPIFFFPQQDWSREVSVQNLLLRRGSKWAPQSASLGACHPSQREWTADLRNHFILDKEKSGRLKIKSKKNACCMLEKIRHLWIQTIPKAWRRQHKLLHIPFLCLINVLGFLKHF